MKKRKICSQKIRTVFGFFLNGLPKINQDQQREWHQNYIREMLHFALESGLNRVKLFGTCSKRYGTGCSKLLCGCDCPVNQHISSRNALSGK